MTMPGQHSHEHTGEKTRASRLPRWRLRDIRRWLHLHDWKPSYLEGITGAAPYEVEFVSDTEVSVRLPFECSCGRFAIVRERQAADTYNDYIENMLGGGGTQ